MVRVRKSAVAKAREAAALLSVPLVDVLSHAATEFATGILTHHKDMATRRSASIAVLTVAQAKAKAGRGAK